MNLTRTTKSHVIENRLCLRKALDGSSGSLMVVWISVDWFSPLGVSIIRYFFLRRVDCVRSLSLAMLCIDVIQARRTKSVISEGENVKSAAITNSSLSPADISLTGEQTQGKVFAISRHELNSLQKKGDKRVLPILQRNRTRKKLFSTSRELIEMSFPSGFAFAFETWFENEEFYLHVYTMQKKLGVQIANFMWPFVTN